MIVFICSCHRNTADLRFCSPHVGIKNNYLCDGQSLIIGDADLDNEFNKRGKETKTSF